METLATVFSDQCTDERIHCRKRIVKAAPLRGMEENRKSKLVEQKQLVLTSLEYTAEFQIFVRRNTQFIEQFSIGLSLKISEGFPGRLVLLRYNGNHGTNDWSEDKHYSCFHIHKITHELISQGVFEPEQITVTDMFSTFDQALRLFLEETNVQNVTEFFPWYNKQGSLFPSL